MKGPNDMTYQPKASDYRGLTRPEMRETAAEFRRTGHADSDVFFYAYGMADLGDQYFDYPTRGEALDIASRMILREHHVSWKWTRTGRGRTGWLVTVGADRPMFRVAVPYDGSMPTLVSL